MKAVKSFMMLPSLNAYLAIKTAKDKKNIPNPI
jgi:hypothetical protein